MGASFSAKQEKRTLGYNFRGAHVPLLSLTKEAQ